MKTILVFSPVAVLLIGLQTITPAATSTNKSVKTSVEYLQQIVKNVIQVKIHKNLHLISKEFGTNKSFKTACLDIYYRKQQQNMKKNYELLPKMEPNLKLKVGKGQKTRKKLRKLGK